MKLFQFNIRLIGLIIILLFSLIGCSTIYNQLGGPYKGSPADAFKTDGLDTEARLLISQAFKDLEGQIINDYHVHFFGNGKPDIYTYCPELNDIAPQFRPLLNFNRFIESQPFWQRPFVKGVYLDTLDISDENNMDEQYMKRLVDLVSFYGPSEYINKQKDNPYQTHFSLMAMDGTYDKDGNLDPSSLNYVSNEYIVKLAECLNKKIMTSGGFVNNRFIPVGSINPVRISDDGKGYVMRKKQDWLKEMDLLEKKVEWIKWRPPTMGFDPEKISKEFYTELKNHKIGILTHTGKSTAVKVEKGFNQFAGPLKMHKAIESGVKVVLLHTGREGKNTDTGDLFITEFIEMVKKYKGTDTYLRGEISAVPYGETQLILKDILSAENDISEMLVNGSDYPAVSPYILVSKSLKRLKQSGFITADEVKALKQIYQYNPLLFDFVLKRTICIDEKKIPENIFYGSI